MATGLVPGALHKGRNCRQAAPGRLHCQRTQSSAGPLEQLARSTPPAVLISAASTAREPSAAPRADPASYRPLPPPRPAAHPAPARPAPACPPLRRLPGLPALPALIRLAKLPHPWAAPVAARVRRPSPDGRPAREQQQCSTSTTCRLTPPSTPADPDTTARIASLQLAAAGLLDDADVRTPSSCSTEHWPAHPDDRRFSLPLFSPVLDLHSRPGANPLPMASDVLFGPAAPGHRPRFSVSSSSSQASPSSSESPRHTPAFSIQMRYLPASPSDGIVPKIEELDDDDMTDVKVSPSATEDHLPSPSNVVAKKKRGRPRKNPISPASAVSKPMKGRSKTGCITCRRRKKKCDETKPHCIHCQKNNVHCEGYPPREYWKSGKQRPSSGSIDGPPRELPILIEGVETDLDRYFLDHFNFNVSKVLSLFTDQQNPFKELLLPMAIRHRGLMHSLLCLSGSHLTAREANEAFEERQHHHFRCAIVNLTTDQAMQKQIAGDETALIEDPTVAQTLVLCLKSVCAGEVNGSYRPHMDAARHLIQKQKSPNEEFQNFLIEFFIYHDVANSLTSLDRRSVLMMDDFQLPQFMIQPEAATLLGVVDGLFGYISKIRQLRDRIRDRRKSNLKPFVDYEILSDAQIIDVGLRTWVCVQEVGSPRWIASMLYRQCTWLYLHRTILPSAPNASLRQGVDEGLAYLRQLPSDSVTQSILLMPLFLLGCAAFEPEQRPDIRTAFGRLQDYSALGNIKYAREIVEDVWQMMDAGDEDSWDWETIISKKGWDFLVT